MVDWTARRERRKGLAHEDRFNLIDDDLDENNRSHNRMRQDISAVATKVEGVSSKVDEKLDAIWTRLTVMIVSLATGAILLALNLVVMARSGS